MLALQAGRGKPALCVHTCVHACMRSEEAMCTCAGVCTGMAMCLSVCVCEVSSAVQCDATPMAAAAGFPGSQDCALQMTSQHFRPAPARRQASIGRWFLVACMPQHALTCRRLPRLSETWCALQTETILPASSASQYQAVTPIRPGCMHDPTLSVWRSTLVLLCRWSRHRWRTCARRCPTCTIAGVPPFGCPVLLDDVLSSAPATANLQCEHSRGHRPEQSRVAGLHRGWQSCWSRAEGVQCAHSRQHVPAEQSNWSAKTMAQLLGSC